VAGDFNVDARVIHLPMTSTHQTPRVAVIGAGWAGLSAAVELAAQGIRVEVFEASRQLGGRARSLTWGDLTIDNGQHILVGAYRECLRLMRTVGIDPDLALLRIPLTLNYPGNFHMRAPRLPAPLHTAAALLFASGLSWPEKWAAIRFMRALQSTHYRVEPDITVSDWLDQHRVPPRQRQLLWDALCISALNTPSDRASAQILANVLRDSLGADRAASDMLIPRSDMSACFPDAAARFVQQKGGVIHSGQRIDSLRKSDAGWHVGKEALPYTHLIIAVAPYHLGSLLPESAQLVAHIAYEPIVTTYLRYPAHITLPGPMIGHISDASQWLFDRGQLYGQHGLIAAVISARGRHNDLTATELEAAVHRDIAQHIPTLPEPLGALTITEKRATFSCTPSLIRPAFNALAAQHIYLAGDYVSSDYPGTLEAAVRSGVACAQHITGAQHMASST
jgi:hydroxysqualene dehydroxylase